MNTKLTPKCKKCGHRFPLGFDDGCDLPIMVTFQLEDGSKVNMCRDCLIDLGKAKENGTEDEFWDGVL